MQCLVLRASCNVQDAVKLSPHVPPPTPQQKEALAFAQEVAREQRLRFDYQLNPGIALLLASLNAAADSTQVLCVHALPGAD